MLIYEKKAQKIYFALYDVNGESIPGLTASDIVFRYAKSNSSALNIKELTIGENGNFFDLGFGLYSVDLAPEETDIIGQFAVVITSVDLGPSAPSPIPQEVDPKHMMFDVVPQPVLPDPDVPTCLVHGSVRELGGEPSDKPMVVYSQVLSLPSIVDGNFISSKPKTSYTDEDGLFKIKLAVGAEVRVEIPDAGVRRQFTVPDLTTAKLRDLPTP